MVNSTKKNPAALTSGSAVGDAPANAAVAGVDGCPAGWVAVRLTGESGVPAAEVYPDWAALVRGLGDAVRICVDMPIGLRDWGSRPCDRAARALLPPARKSSVFAPPRRYMLGRSYDDVRAAARARGDAGLSIQAYNIMPKIAELDAALAPPDQARVLESHPELAFHRLNAGSELPRKADRAGRAARRALLRAAGLSAVDALLAAHPRARAKADDVLDAAVCALVARDSLHGRARRVPDGEPGHDARGLRMEIWY
jgi:predicted RNase H-like nuclease